MTDNASWLAAQNGAATEVASVDPAGRRYIHSSRTLAEYVHGVRIFQAYPAGHATVAGACTTILKALFDESALVANPEEIISAGTIKQAYTGSDTLTLGGELNKLAANVSLGT
jgi:hypothetical protein